MNLKIYENGAIRDETEAEIAEIEAIDAREREAAKHRPFTEAEVQGMLIRAQINALPVNNATALRMIAFYPPWETDTAYTSAAGRAVGYKVSHGGKLWKLRQEHTSQAGWEPGAAGTESLWEEVCEGHAGTVDDPIPYGGNMALVSDLYYSQNGVVYRCTRDTGVPVYHALADLVGLYVEIVEV